MENASRFYVLCRLCIAETHTESSLKASNKSIAQKIFNLLTIKIHESDKLPISICKPCAKTVDQLNKFRESCMRNQEILLHLGEVVNNESFMYDEELDHHRKSDLNLMEKDIPIKEENGRVYLNNPEILKDPIMVKQEILELCNQSTIELELIEKNFQTIADNSILHMDNSTNVLIKIEEKSQLFKNDENTNPISFKDNTKISYTCQYCLKSFRSKIGLTQHETEHTGLLACHIKNKQEQGRQKCHMDNSTNLPTKIGEKTQLFKNDEHTNQKVSKDNSIISYTCQFCSKGFRSKIGLSQHEAEHTGNFKLFCSKCGKGFQCQSYLRLHQRIHNNDRPYKCATCPKSFKTKVNLVDHINRHLGTKQFSCDICDRRFISQGLLTFHIKSKHEHILKKHPCSVCGKQFTDKNYLTIHKRIHTGEKPFDCDVCNKGFLSKSALRVHLTTHTGGKSYVCENCGKSFGRLDNFRIHMRVHTKERPYKCDDCGQTFTQLPTLTIHKRKHTGERPYECDVCLKRFSTKSSMTVHRKTHARK